MAKITGKEAKRKRLRFTKANFYAAPRTPASKSDLPIFDKSHVRNAMARFDQVKFRSKAEAKRAYMKVLKAARKFKIQIKKFLKLRPK